MNDLIDAAIIHHREACAIRDAACLAFDNTNEDEECSATKSANDYMIDTADASGRSFGN